MDKVRAFEESDYAEVCSWWAARKWPILPIAMLPQIGGIVDGKAAAFLYRTDSTVGWLTWVISNPDNEGSRAVPAVLHFLCDKAQEVGIKQLFTEVEHPYLIKAFSDAGFVKGDTLITNMVRRF